MAASDRLAWGVLSGLGIAVLLVVGWMLWPVPQLGADERVMKSVDALFTAITAKDERRLAACRERLEAHEKAGLLPVPAAGRLKAIMGRAQAGQWKPAAQSLYSFMQAQRREGKQ